MKNLILGLLSGAILGSIAGFAAGVSCIPFRFSPPAVDQTVSDVGDRVPVARGVFIHADPSDPMHYGSGSVTLYENSVQLEQDFEVGPGPKYHLYLVPDADVTTDTRVEETMFVDLGPLSSFAGRQRYSIPEGIDLTDYETVVIWCEHFNLLISPARLRSPQQGA